MATCPPQASALWGALQGRKLMSTLMHIVCIRPVVNLMLAILQQARLKLDVKKDFLSLKRK